MITLYKSRAAWGTPDLSPFAIKLETYLRMAGHPYQVARADIRKAPKGKLPYVDIDGTLMGDSHLIIEHLKATQGDPLDRHLDAERRAIGHAVRRTLEEGTYFTTVYQRWIPDESFAVLRPEFLAFLPKVVGPFILSAIRKKVRQSLHSQGTGRHQPAEIAAMGIADLTAVSTILGDRPFLLGDEPTSFDATVYAFLLAITGFPVDTAIRAHAQQLPNLGPYLERVKSRFWADWKPSDA